MRKLAVVLAASVIFLAVGLASAKGRAPKARVFAGEISDSQCAATKDHSHAGMLKMAGMGDKNPNDSMAKAMCTKKCVQMGGKYVLYNPKTKSVYQLDDQTKPEQFAGQNVKVTGTLDKATGTIHVESIKAAT